MPAGGDWAVAFIILIIFVLLVGALVAVCHLCHFPSLTSLLSSGAGDEEKTVLTNTDHFLAAHYLVSIQVPLHLRPFPLSHAPSDDIC